MDRAALCLEMRDLMELIVRGEEGAARERFDAKYPEMHPLLRQGEPLSWAATFLFDLDEYLHAGPEDIRPRLTLAELNSRFREFEKDALG